MRLLKFPNIASAHEAVVKLINDKGETVATEDGELTKEIIDVQIIIDNPFASPRSSIKMFMKQRALDEYTKAVIEGIKSNFVYDYHGRLYHWGETRDFPGLNQIQYIKGKLHEKSTSRRALAVTWIPMIDCERKDVPCLQLIQFLIRKGKLYMFVLFRSEDMLSAAGANIYALTELQRKTAEELGVSIGPYIHQVVSAHIYHIRDSHELSKFIE